MPRFKESDSDDSRLIVSGFLDLEAKDSLLIHRRRRFSNSDSDDNPLICQLRFSDSDDDEDRFPIRFKRPRERLQLSEEFEEEEEENKTGNPNPNVVVTLSNPGLLDCPICFEPLTVPVFQCDQNGHLASSSCCTKIKNKCPSCSCPIGSNRCSAMEKVVESSTTSCRNKKYGCTTPVYNKKNEHERTCKYSPTCSCPYLGCEFVSSTMELYLHYINDHGESAIEFESDNFFTITLKKYNKSIVLRERDVSTLFILHNNVDALGNVVSLSCIQPIFKEGFIYNLVARHTGSDSVKLRSLKHLWSRISAGVRDRDFQVQRGGMDPDSDSSDDDMVRRLPMFVRITPIAEEEDQRAYARDYEDHASTSASREGSNIVINLTDPGLLDCPICCEPLTVPVFQCDQNGHIACSLCCSKINNKCPFCTCPIGSNRCRAIEKVVESSTTRCQNSRYGCNIPVAYNKKNEHEKTCVCAPCSCPYIGCNFASSAKELYQHFSNAHLDSATSFLYDNNNDGLFFPIILKRDDSFLVVREKHSGTLFILYNRTEILGNVVTVCCIQPSFMDDFIYVLLVSNEESSLKFRSVTKSTPTLQVDGPSPTSFLLIPNEKARATFP
ncbi:hypothetical protein ACLB2K_012740 [Fragaria x ananassa]